MITLDALYIVTGLMFGAFAVSHALDRSHPARWRSAAFWGLFASSLLFGSHLSDLANGILVLGLVALATLGLKPAPMPTTSPEDRETLSHRIGNALFIPALIVPAVTLTGSLLMPDGKIAGHQILAPKQVTLICLGIGAFIGLGAALWLTRAPARAAIQESRRLADSVGWALVLPQMLAALGALFALTGVGDVVSKGISENFAITQPWMAAALYCVGMAVFTMVMGNAFAAFPVMTAGVGLPLVVGQFGGDPAIMCALGMLSGFCGTLMTPMAANFNVVPAAILELPDRNAVIKVQIPTAIALLICNILILSLFGFPK